MATKVPTLQGPYGGNFVNFTDATALHMARTEFYQDANNLEAATPFISGHGLVLPLKMPKIMVDNYFSMTVIMHKTFLSYIKGIDGFNNWSVESDDVNFGPEGSKMRQDLKTGGLSDDFTITLATDFAALPITKWLRLYVSQIQDPYTGRSYTKNSTNLEFSQANHSMEFMVIICNPSYNAVVDVAYLQNCVFTEAKWDTLNHTSGEEGVAELAIPMKGKQAKPTAAMFAAANTYLTALRGVWAIRENGGINKTIDLGNISDIIGTGATSSTTTSKTTAAPVK